MECDRFYDFILYMSSYFLQWCFSRWTERNPYYEILRAHQQYAKDSYGGENDLGLRCKRHQKHSKTCSCPFGVMVQSGYFVGKMSMIQCGQLWAMRNYTNGSGHRLNWCYFLFTKVVYGVQNRKTRRKFYFFVVSKSSQFRWENTLVSISGGSGIRPSCSSCLIKPKSNGYKRDVVNTSIELQLFEVIHSYYFLCNLVSSYGGLWNWTLYAFVVLEVHVTKKSDTEKSKSNRTAASSNDKYYCWLCCSPQLVSPRCLGKLSAKRPLNENVYVELIKWC